MCARRPSAGESVAHRNRRCPGGGWQQRESGRPYLPPAFIISLPICRELETPPREQCELGHALYCGQAGVCLGLALRGCAFTGPPGAKWVILDDGAERALRICLVQLALYAWENVASPWRCQESGVRETTCIFFQCDLLYYWGEPVRPQGPD